MSDGCPFETFPALDECGVITHAFVQRAPGIDVKTDRVSALSRLRALHDKTRAVLRLTDRRFVTAEQIHGASVACVDATLEMAPGADALITNRPDVCLGIYVADCAAVYLVDPVQRAIGLIHSGRKGTELGIVPETVNMMQSKFGSLPRDLIAQLSPCIRPPDYETDFAAQIIEQCRSAGLTNVHDSGANTAADLGRYYSYRVERGQTGRMVAVLALE